MPARKPQTKAVHGKEAKESKEVKEAKKNAGVDKISGGLGQRLRQSREQTGISVRELARRVGVSPSLISQIERDLVMPSVGTLFSMANELRLVVDDLFRSADSPATGRNAPRDVVAGPVQRPEGRQVIKLAAGARWERLTAMADPEVDFLYVVYDVGGASCDADQMFRHEGKEYAYLLSGHLGVQIGFETYELGPGDSMSFDSQMPHRLWNMGRQPAVAIWAVIRRNNDSRTGPSTGTATPAA